MKKSLCVLLVLATSALSVFADAFTYAIQDLAIQTACIGKYSMTEAGGGWYEDPDDWYTPQMMAERFAKMSGNMTRITTFYGICFDYADFAWHDIVKYKNSYNQVGMYEGQFWLAGVHSNSNQIELMSIAEPGESYTRKQNGVSIKTYSNSIRNVKTHRLMNKGDRATYHAWLWIERSDGVWFWIDPTWTDNLGYVVYGYVKNGEEIQCRPDKDFCINYPSELDSLPLPPSMGARMSPSTSANSTDRNETIKDAGISWYDIAISPFVAGLNYDKNFIPFLASANVPFLSFADRSLNVNQMAFALETPVLLDNGFFMLGLEYLRNIDDDHSIHSALFTSTGTGKLTSFLSWYLGIGIGLRFDTSNDDNYVPGKIEYLARTGWFAFKGDIGLLLNISQIFYTKIGAAYDNVLGFSVEAGIGFGFKRKPSKQ